MHRHGIFHPCRQNFLVRDASPRDFSSLQTESPRQGCIATGFFILADKIPSSGMHLPGIFHPCRQNLLGRDASPQDFSSLQTKFPRQGCIAPGFFILADRIFSSGMHRPGIFHPCRQNLLVRDAAPRDFSSLQTESPRQGCIATGFFIPADRISSAGMHRPEIFHPYRQNLLGRDASSPQLCPKLAGRLRSPPSSPQFTSSLAGRTLIKPAVPIFKLSAFIPDDLFPVSRGTFRIQSPHDEFSFA